MTIEKPRVPVDREDMVALTLDLMREFDAQGLHLEPDPAFGSIRKDCFGFSVSDEVNQLELGFLQIIFDPNGWTGLAGQNENGKRVLSALSTALGRDPQQMKLEELAIRYAMYQTYFPYLTPPESHG